MAMTSSPEMYSSGSENFSADSTPWLLPFSDDREDDGVDDFLLALLVRCAVNVRRAKL